MMKTNDEKYTIKFSIRYLTALGQNIYILGDIPELGNWKERKFKLKWSEGHIWKGTLELPESVRHISYKFVCMSDDGNYKRWEEGPDRIFCRDLPCFKDDKKIKLDCNWEHFGITFHIFYPLKNEFEYFQIIGRPKALGGWFRNGGNPVKMSLSEPKTIEGITGRFWEATIHLPSNKEDSLSFDYRYSIYNPIKGNVFKFYLLRCIDSAIWEREPNRKLKLLTEYSIVQNEDLMKEFSSQVGREIEILANSHIKRLDVNFVSELKFNKIGDHDIYIGPYPQNEEDISLLARSEITGVLNVQTDMDFTHRQINWTSNLNSYKKHEIEIVRYPIRDFDSEDLSEKLKGAAEKLKDLLQGGKSVYVHCTAGMSRAAATVIAYLVLYDNYSLEEAYEYVKFYRNIICPNMTVLSKVLSMDENKKEITSKELNNYKYN